MFRYNDFRMGKIKGTEQDWKGTKSNWLRIDFFLQSITCCSYFNVRIEALNLFVKKKVSMNHWRLWNQEF